MEYSKNRKQSEEELRKEKENAFRSALKQSPSIGGLWLLCGPESYLSKEYALRMRKHIIPNPEQEIFDYVRISGMERRNSGSEDDPSEKKDSSSGDFPLIRALQEACATVPVMNEGKLIELSEIPFDSLSKKNLTLFCDTLRYAAACPGVTVLMQCTEDEFPVISSEGKKAKWTETRELLEKAGVSVIVYNLQEERTLLPWCERHFESEGVTADKNTVSVFLRRCGPSMFTLDGEIKKVAHYVKDHGRTTVLQGDILTVTSSADKSEDFAVQNAVRSRNVPSLLSACAEAKMQKEKAVVLSAQLAGTLSEIWRVSEAASTGKTSLEIATLLHMKEYPVRLDMKAAKLYPRHVLIRLLSRCEEADTALKTSFEDEYLVLERLVCEFAVGVYD